MLSLVSKLLVTPLVFMYVLNVADSEKIRKVEKLKRKNDLPVGNCRIVIDKSDYLLRLYDEQGLFARYPVVFGSEPEKDKFKEGDRRTPEGSFTIQSIKKHKKWDYFLLLDYPNKLSIEKFERRKKEQVINEMDEIGGSIGIHGTWPNDNYLIDRYKNWTDGCISLKNAAIRDLMHFIKPGTEVIIQK